MYSLPEINRFLAENNCSARYGLNDVSKDMGLILPLDGFFYSSEGEEFLVNFHRNGFANAMLPFGKTGHDNYPVFNYVDQNDGSCIPVQTPMSFQLVDLDYVQYVELVSTSDLSVSIKIKNTGLMEKPLAVTLSLGSEDSQIPPLWDRFTQFFLRA